MQVYKYTVHGQNSLAMEKPNKKTQKHANSVSFKKPFHEMAPETSSVIGYGEVHVQCEKKHCHYCSDKETEEDTSVTEILVNVDKPRSKTQTQMHFLR